MLVLVEGESDAGALHAVAGLLGLDLRSAGIEVRSAAGITNFPKLLVEFLRLRPGAAVSGMYDSADERHVRRALIRAGYGIRSDQAPEAFGFYACEPDLEAELIRALGSPTVQQVLEAQGELASFRRFQAMPQHRGSKTHAQLHRFLGTRATRKIRCARLLAELLNPASLPRPLAHLAHRMRMAAKSGPCGAA